MERHSRPCTVYSTTHRPGSNGACASGSRRSGWSTPQLVRKVDYVASYLCTLEQSHVPLKPRLMLDNQGHRRRMVFRPKVDWIRVHSPYIRCPVALNGNVRVSPRVMNTDAFRHQNHDNTPWDAIATTSIGVSNSLCSTIPSKAME